VFISEMAREGEGESEDRHPHSGDRESPRDRSVRDEDGEVSGEPDEALVEP